jgi:hypothetical protein
MGSLIPADDKPRAAEKDPQARNSSRVLLLIFAAIIVASLLAFLIFRPIPAPS